MNAPSAHERVARSPGEHRDAPIDPLEGTPYRTVGRLGRGGMGIVLEAEHRRLGSRVVVKTLHAHLAGIPDLVDRMHLEARVLAALPPHPHIVAVLDGGTTADGRPYIAMEKLAGRSLHVERRLRGRLPPFEAIEWTRQLLEGLAIVHRAGVVHRDVKPANLFLCDADRSGPRVLKLLDFGVAKILGGGAAEPRVAARALATEQSALIGTPHYLAPEQAIGGEVDARTDLYAAGAVLYELLAGKSPFEHHADVADLLRATLGEAPRPPSDLAGSAISPDLDRAVLRALAKRPADRFPDADGFAAELSRIARRFEPPPEAAKIPRAPATPLERTYARPLAFAAVWVLSMALTVGVGLLAAEVFR